MIPSFKHIFFIEKIFFFTGIGFFKSYFTLLIKPFIESKYNEPFIAESKYKDKWIINSPENHIIRRNRKNHKI